MIEPGVPYSEEDEQIVFKYFQKTVNRTISVEKRSNFFSNYITVENLTAKPILLVYSPQELRKTVLKQLELEGKADGGKFVIELDREVNAHRVSKNPIGAADSLPVYLGGKSYISVFVLEDGKPDLTQSHGVDVPSPCGVRLVVSGQTMDASVQIP